MAKSKWYYKVKPEFDGKRIFLTKKRSTDECIYLIKNELITFEYAAHWNIPEKYLDRVCVPIDSVYWFFGARYSDLYPYE